MQITLPFPPSVNGYWRNLNGRTLLSKKGREYKKSVKSAVLYQGANKQLTGRLSVVVELYPPDKRRRDIDNFGGKALLDAMQTAGVYRDDSQIDSLWIKRMEIEKGGVCKVIINEG